MKRNSRRILPLLAVLATTFSACNRGYGCPGSNFSVEELLSTVISLLA